MSDAQNTTRAADEVEVMRQIYGADNVSFLASTGALSITLPQESRMNAISISCLLPSEYPSNARPHNVTLRVYGLSAAEAEAVVRDAQLDEKGEEDMAECIFQYCQCISDACSSAIARKAAVNFVPALTSHKRESLFVAPVFHSETLTVRKSSFQAHAAYAGSVDEALSFVAHLLASFPKIRSSTHNVMAYRVGNAQDCDDDGESAAGKGLLFTLQQMNADKVVVVVSRWFGGIVSAWRLSCILSPSRSSSFF
jgi:hypothetical protein